MIIDEHITPFKGRQTNMTVGSPEGVLVAQWVKRWPTDLTDGV